MEDEGRERPPHPHLVLPSYVEWRTRGGRSNLWKQPKVDRTFFFFFNSTCEAASGPELRELNGQEKKERGWGGGV